MVLLQLMRKNQYEEALFRAEDDRFELDMIIECGASAIQRMQPLAEHLMALEQDEKANYRLPEGALGPIHFRAVQKIYGTSRNFVYYKSCNVLSVPYASQSMQVCNSAPHLCARFLSETHEEIRRTVSDAEHA